MDPDAPRPVRPEEVPHHTCLASVPELLLDVRNSYGSNYGPSEGQIAENLSSKNILILDDFGAEKQTQWGLSVVYLILNRRMDNLRPTIITSNLSLKEISDIEPRLASRIGSMNCLAMKGKDRRLERKQ